MAYRTRKPPLRRMPILTLALLKLDEKLQPYCRFLEDPTYENVQSACALLDSTVATASPSSSEKGSPAFVGSPRGSSPRSPIRSWLSGSSDSPPSVSNSALALEGEWEGFIVPLFLLAGAEAVYASLGHASNPFVAHNLRNLYEHITKDLHLVSETLCDPFLSAEAGPFTASLAMYMERASSVAASLQALVVLAENRCQLIKCQSTMWEAGGNPNFGILARNYHDILPNLPREGARAKPMVDALEREVHSWEFLMETAHSLERCRYVRMVEF